MMRQQAERDLAKHGLTLADFDAWLAKHKSHVNVTYDAGDDRDPRYFSWHLKEYIAIMTCRGGY